MNTDNFKKRYKELFFNENDSPVVFKAENGEEIKFKKLGFIPYRSKEVDFYYVLTPLNPNEDEKGMLIVCNSRFDENGQIALSLEHDERICDAVLKEYEEIFLK